jgi:hypothetical protein
MSKDLKETQNVVIGVIAAVIEGVILQPTIYWKTAKAQGLPFTVNPRIIYRGTGASIYNECQMMGLQFGITGYFQRSFALTSSLSPSTSDRKLRTDNFFAAVLGGGFTAFFASPVELIMIQQQLNGGSFFITPYRIARFHGLFGGGMMRGLTANILRDSIYVSGMLGLTPIIQEYFMKTYHDMSLAQASFYASMIGGTISAIPSHPFDMIKTCMQGDLDKKVYNGFIHTCRTLWKQGGIRRFYHGTLWRTINVLGTVYVANECRNRLPELLF